MTTLLRIDSSSRLADSCSRELGDYFEKSWVSHRAGRRVVRRDLAAKPVPHIAHQTIVGYYTPADRMTAELRSATSLSDALIAELKTADVLVLTVPMYNFSIPSSLKAWIDQIVRIGHTFSFDGTRFGGLVPTERAYVFCAYGASGYAPGGPLSPLNFLEPYLRALLGFLGVKEVRFFSVEATTVDPNRLADNVEQAKRRIDAEVLHA